MVVVFKVGDEVSGMYHAGASGTVLDSGGKVISVTGIAGGFRVAVEFRDGRTEEYTVSRSGACDYMYKNASNV